MCRSTRECLILPSQHPSRKHSARPDWCKLESRGLAPRPVVDAARFARAPIERSCRLTGTTKAALLIASHIKPWRLCRMAQERLGGTNGLMMTLTLICALAADSSVLKMSAE